MNLFEILKQFKAIRPDANFSEVSKRAILATMPATPPVWTARRTFLRIIETGVAVALTVFFVLLISGGFLGSKLAPQYSAIDPQGLRAEAQAIDMQIQLSNINYSAPTASAESTAPTPAGIPKKGSAPKTAAPLVIPGTEGIAATSSSASSTLSIDQTLQGLSN
jgi:hypothetical protein